MSNKAKIREAAKELVPIDDIMFCKMAEDRDFCEEILKVILEDPRLTVISNTPQYVGTNLQGRSVRLDTLCILGSGLTVSVEVQKSDNDDHQRRVRYNSSVLTANITDPGTNFKDVPDVYAVFISRFDIFKDNHALYHVDRVVRESGRIVENGLREIYVNATVKDGTDVSELMEVFISQNAYNDKFPITSSIKHRYKETEEGKKIMSNSIDSILEQLSQEKLAEGLAEGRAEGRTKAMNDINALNMRLIADDRMDDLKRAASDIDYQLKLLNELFPDSAH